MTGIEGIVEQLKAEKERISQAIAALESVSGSTGGSTSSIRRKRTVSASVRRRIAAAQRARWAKVKGTQSAISSKRRISAAGIARIRAAAKARWAKVRTAKK